MCFAMDFPGMLGSEGQNIHIPTTWYVIVYLVQTSGFDLLKTWVCFPFLEPRKSIESATGFAS